MPAVQFYGMDQVMQAAENRGCSCWAIFIGKNLFSKYEDTDFQASMNILLENIDVLAKCGSNGIYTLKFFECEGNQPKKINEKTVCDGGSFTFKMVEPEEREMRSMQYSQGTRYLEQQIGTLMQEIKTLKEQKPEEPETLEQAAVDILKDPPSLALYVNIFRSLAGMEPKNFGPAATLGSLGVNNLPAQIPDKEKVDRLEVAFDTLEKKDPNLIVHLEKLAAMDDKELKGLLALLDLKK